MSRKYLGWLLCTFAVAACTGDGAEEAAMEPGGGGSITLWTDSTELFMEYPPLVVGQPDKFAVHLTDLSDFAPLRGGNVRFIFTPREGQSPVVVDQNTPRAPGIYGPEPTFTTAGIHDLMIVIESPQIRDTVRVPGLPVYESVAALPQPEADGGSAAISFLKEQQWKTPGFRTESAGRREIAGTVMATGEILPASSRHARVSAPVSGVVELSGTAAPGGRVQRGQRIAVITPALGEGVSALAAARRELREAEDEHARATRLYAAEAIPQRRLHEADGRLAAARETLAGLGGAVTTEDGRVVITAPIGGVVSDFRLVAGGQVAAGEHLLTVVDPSVVWLSARLPAAQAAAVRGSRGAWFTPEDQPERFRTTRTLSIGAMIDSVTRTIPVLFEVANPRGALTIGSLVQVEVETARRTDGVAIPLSALLEDDGRPIAYVQPTGEEFERRELRLGPRDGTHVLVLSGIEAGERVVTGGAVQVRLASMSTAVPEHGHEH